jgi:hypothetical protein
MFRRPLPNGDLGSEAWHCTYVLLEHNRGFCAGQSSFSPAIIYNLCTQNPYSTHHWWVPVGNCWNVHETRAFWF